MIKSHARTVNGCKGVELTIMGDNEVLFNEFYAIFKKAANDDKLNQIVEDVLESLIQEARIKNFKENK